MVRRECGMRMGMGDESEKEDQSEARGKERNGRAQSGSNWAMRRGCWCDAQPVLCGTPYCSTDDAKVDLYPLQSAASKKDGALG